MYKRQLLSYAVGCLFGRYSLDEKGLCYAGGDWDASKYKTILPVKDNVLPICDDDYLESDLTGKIVEFVKIVYGEDTLEENLKFIADALGTKGATPREAIRNYLLNGFYADHCKIYQKRPIYWLFSSGKKNAFKALVYMHRWEKTTVATVRTDYVHELQERYRTQLSMLGDQMEHAAQSERVKLKKRQEKLTAQLDEINAYEEKVHHLADRMMDIDLDDGVKVNYAKFAEILEKIKLRVSTQHTGTDLARLYFALQEEELLTGCDVTTFHKLLANELPNCDLKTVRNLQISIKKLNDSTNRGRIKDNGIERSLINEWKTYLTEVNN